MTTELDIREGGKKILLTLDGSTWRSVGFDDERQNIIDGLVSDGSESLGWNNVVQAGLPVTAVVRTSDTVVTITLTSFPTYDIEEPETITATIPSSALNSGGDTVASPTFTIGVIGGDVGDAPYDSYGEITRQIAERRRRQRRQLLQLVVFAAEVMENDD